MERRPQRGLLAREPAEAVPAHHHRSRVSLRSGQRRAPGGQPALAVVVDQAPDRRRQEEQGPGHGRHRVPDAREPQDPGLHADARGGPGAGRRQPVAIPSIRRAGPGCLRRQGPVRDLQQRPLSDHRQAAVPADAVSAHVLLVQVAAHGWQHGRDQARAGQAAGARELARTGRPRSRVRRGAGAAGLRHRQAVVPGQGAHHQGRACRRSYRARSRGCGSGAAAAAGGLHGGRSRGVFDSCRRHARRGSRAPRATQPGRDRRPGRGHGAD